jgi:hypothetical protein
MARKPKHNRSSYTLDATRGTPGTGQDNIGKAQGTTQGCTLAKKFTPQDVEYSLLKVLTPALQAREGTVYSFADWTMAGNGAVVVLENGQEFRMEIVEAK